MQPLSNKISQKGFTLIELLVVIAMIAGLSSIAAVITLRQIDSGNDIKAAVMAQQFALISEKWEEDFYSYPHASSLPNSPETDEAYLTGNNDPSSKIISNMLGQNASLNKDKINYLDSFPVKSDGKGGLVQANVQGTGSSGGGNSGGGNSGGGNSGGGNSGGGNSGGGNSGGGNSGGGGGSSNSAIKSLMDPWGNPFIVIFDHDLNGDIEAPSDEFLDAYAGETWRNTNMVIISAGRNGLFDKDKDIVYKY